MVTHQLCVHGNLRPSNRDWDTSRCLRVLLVPEVEEYQQGKKRHYLTMLIAEPGIQGPE